MEAQEFKDLIPDYILGKLTANQDKIFNKYLLNNPDALTDWQELKENLLVNEFEPSKALDAKFYAFLNGEIKENNEDNKVKSLPFQKTSKSSFFRILFPLLAASIILFFGFFIGKQWQFNNASSGYNITEVEIIKKETDAVRTQLVMSLANQPSASMRLQATSEAIKLENVTDKVIVALFKMLNADTNVNVRLATVASLSKYVDYPKVREGLVMSITKQESPLVQIALADLMVTLKEKKSINSMETLLQQPDINVYVKEKLEASIKQII